MSLRVSAGLHFRRKPELECAKPRAPEARQHANIVELTADQSPPKGSHWAMVVINEADATVGAAHDSSHHGRDILHEAAQCRSRSGHRRATAWADARGVEFVYVRRLGARVRTH
jgi:hypothetical protein